MNNFMHLNALKDLLDMDKKEYNNTKLDQSSYLLDMTPLLGMLNMHKLEDLKKFAEEAHQVSRSKGWYDPELTPATDLERHMLIVSEIAEATEEVRNGNPPIYQIYESDGFSNLKTKILPIDYKWSNSSKPEGEAVELADAIIRILDYAEAKKLPLIEAMLMKNEYNKTRPYRHGGKLK